MILYQELENLFKLAVSELSANYSGTILEKPKSSEFGELTTSVAMKICKELKLNPTQVAEQIVAKVKGHESIADITIAKPGFINIRLTPATKLALINEVISSKDRFGSKPLNQQKVLLEFVSANPTGPLHIGHGRAAALGDSLARILKFVGYEVSTEYYVNDQGLQISVLAASVWLRVLQEKNLLEHDLPDGVYQGEYLIAVARKYIKENENLNFAKIDLSNLSDDKDQVAIEVVTKVSESLQDEFARLKDFATNEILNLIKSELTEFRVIHDNWFSEKSLHTDNSIENAINNLTNSNSTYEQDGALWFAASKYGDEKDWVLIRNNQQFTYLASDIAYHSNKAKRDYDCNLNLLGSDHHGYVPRLKAYLRASNENVNRFEFSFIQFVSLINAGDRIKMSTRAGKYHLLRDLLTTIGVDAARLFFVLSKGDVHMDFDIKKASQKTNENPVYYLQYAHARTCSLLEKWGGDIKSIEITNEEAITDVDAQKLIFEMFWFGETIQAAANNREPHRIAHWLISFAGYLHKYYDRIPILKGDENLINDRITLLVATRQVLGNALNLLGISAPTKM